MTGKIVDSGSTDCISYNIEDGFMISDARYLLHTKDGADIGVKMTGRTAVRNGPVHVHARFETANEAYRWMNNILAVGILVTRHWGYTVDMWQLTSPM